MDAVECFEKCNSGVFRIANIIYGGREVGSGTGFLIEGGIVTNSHVIRKGMPEFLSIKFDNDGTREIRIEFKEDLVVTESPEDEKDYVVLKIDEPEFEPRHRFILSEKPEVRTGQKVCFLGYPFGFEQLTCHVGYISSIFEIEGVIKYRIDGSINHGNSGGPLVSLESNKVVGIISRTETGLLQQQFSDLIASFEHNAKEIKESMRGAQIIIGGINPAEGFVIAQNQMKELASNIERSANVGIGYAFSVKYLSDALNESKKRTGLQSHKRS